MMTTGDLLDQTASWTIPQSASAVSPFTLLHDVGNITFSASLTAAAVLISTAPLSVVYYNIRNFP